MERKFITTTLAVMLAVYAVANQERNQRGFDKGVYIEEEEGDFEGKSDERDASASGESDRCGKNIGISNINHESYEKDRPYRKENHRVGYSSSTTSASASADASAKAYEHGHKDTFLFNN